MLTQVHLAGERLLLDPGGGLYWPRQRLLAIADLHLEKGSAAALPPWDTRATLDRLARLLARHNPAVVVALGDSFHDTGGAGRMQPADAARLASLVEGRQMVWILGNHDPAPPSGLPGEASDALRREGLVLRHIATEQNDEISGHYHPKASVVTAGALVTRSCFVASRRRILLPALGAYTGGLDVRDPAIARLFPEGGRVFLLGRNRVFGFALPARGDALQKPASSHI